jgi:uncharacterized membrane protein YgcG
LYRYVKEHYEAANEALRAQLDEARGKTPTPAAAAAAAVVTNAVLSPTMGGVFGGAVQVELTAALERARVAEERVKLLEARLGGGLNGAARGVQSGQTVNGGGGGGGSGDHSGGGGGGDGGAGRTGCHLCS